MLQQHARAAKATGQVGDTGVPSTALVSTNSEPTTASARKRLKMQRKRAARMERQRAGQEEADSAASIADAISISKNLRGPRTNPGPVAKAVWTRTAER